MIRRCANYVYLCSTETFCVVYVFAVAHSSHVDDSSHVSVDYFFYMSCIFLHFVYDFCMDNLHPKKFISKVCIFVIYDE